IANQIGVSLAQKSSLSAIGTPWAGGSTAREQPAPARATTIAAIRQDWDTIRIGRAIWLSRVHDAILCEFTLSPVVRASRWRTYACSWCAVLNRVPGFNV